MSELGSSLSQLRRQGLHKAKTIKVPEKPIGIKTPLERGSRKSESLFRMHFDISKQIEDNLKNLIMTQKGERLGFPTFGTQLKSIYSNNTLSQDQVAEIASKEIENAVSEFMPSITLLEFYSEKIDLAQAKLNSSNNKGYEFLINQNNTLDLKNSSIKEINKNNKDLDSIYEIKIKYSIPLLNRTKEITLTINSSK